VNRIARTFLWLLTGFLILCLGLSLCILLPPVQTKIIHEISSRISKKTGTGIAIGRVRILFPDRVMVSGILLEDEGADSLLWADKISANLKLLPLLKRRIEFDRLELLEPGFRIVKYADDRGYNYRALLKAFGSTDDYEPDTTAGKPWQVLPGLIEIQRARFSYTDSTDSLQMDLNAGLVRAEIQRLDIGTDAEEGIDHSGGTIAVIARLRLRSISLTQQRGTRDSVQVWMGGSSINGLMLDLSRQILRISSLEIENPSLRLGKARAAGEAQSGQAGSDMSFPLDQFPWKIEILKATLTDGSLAMPHPEEDQTDRIPGRLNISSLNLSIDSTQIDSTELRLNLRKLQLVVNDSLRLSGLKGRVTFGQRQLSARQIELTTPHSAVQADLLIRYRSFQELIRYPGSAEIGVSIRPSGISLRDIQRAGFQFNPIYSDLLRGQLRGNLEVHGKVDDFLADLTVDIPGRISLQMRGAVAGITDLARINFRLQMNHLGIGGDLLSELYNAGPQTEYDTLIAHAALSGRYQAAHLDFNCASPGDSLNLEVDWSGDARVHRFVAKAAVHATRPGRWAAMPELGFLKSQFHADFDLTASGLSRMEAAIYGTQLAYGEYELGNIQAQVDGTDDRFDLKLDISDPQLTAKIRSSIHLQASDFDLEGDGNLAFRDTSAADLRSYSVATRTSFSLQYQDEGHFSSRLELHEPELNTRNGKWQPGSVVIRAGASDSLHHLNLASGFANASLESSFPFHQLSYQIKKLLAHHLHSGNPDESGEGDYLRFSFNLSDPDPLNELFSRNGLSVSPFEARIQFAGDDYRLEAEAKLDKFQYGALSLHGIDFLAVSSEVQMRGKFQLDSIRYDSLHVDQIRLLAELGGGKLNAIAGIMDKAGRQKYHVHALAETYDSLYLIRLLPDAVLNYAAWEVAEDNRLIFGRGMVGASNFFLQHNGSRIDIQAPDSMTLVLSLKEFALRHITAILSDGATSLPLDGSLSGRIDWRPFSGKTRLNWDLSLHHTRVFQVDVGSVITRGLYQADSLLEISGNLRDEHGNVEFRNRMEFRPDAHRITGILIGSMGAMQRFEPFVNTPDVRLSGAIAPELSWGGTTQDPGVRGSLEFSNFELAYLPTNSVFRLSGEMLHFEHQKINFNRFSVLDGADNRLLIDGTIDISTLADPKFQLRIITDRFQLLDQPNRVEQELFGRLLVQTDLNLEGNSGALRMEGRLALSEDTDLHYTFPGSELTLVSDEGVVFYSDEPVTTMSPDSTDTQATQLDSLTNRLSGLTLALRLEIPANAQFHIVTNPDAGDKVDFRLRGALNFRYDPVSKNRLNGSVEFAEGSYELSFYGLVKKTFSFQPGSSVSWTGMIPDGQLNFTAIYEVTTSSLGLVSSVISEAERSKYDRRLPYQVLLKAEGTLAEPKISFGIDLPERFRRENNVIAAKLDALNQPENEAERNRQVFALLVGNTFLPESGGSGGAGGEPSFATTAARNSLNALLTEQLNSLTGRVIRGVDVNLGFTTVEDFSSSQQGQSRNQLDVQVNKNLFNDRVRVEMESHFNLDGNTPQTGTQPANQAEFAVYYKMNPDGNFQIKAFSENAFDMLDGDIQNVGLAILFVKEFDPVRLRKKRTDR
jgi:translocation and assembly module TamB